MTTEMLEERIDFVSYVAFPGEIARELAHLPDGGLYRVVLSSEQSPKPWVYDFSIARGQTTDMVLVAGAGVAEEALYDALSHVLTDVRRLRQAPADLANVASTIARTHHGLPLVFGASIPGTSRLPVIAALLMSMLPPHNHIRVDAYFH